MMEFASNTCYFLGKTALIFFAVVACSFALVALGGYLAHRNRRNTLRKLQARAPHHFSANIDPAAPPAVPPAAPPAAAPLGTATAAPPAPPTPVLPPQNPSPDCKESKK